MLLGKSFRMEAGNLKVDTLTDFPMVFVGELPHCRWMKEGGRMGYIWMLSLV